VDLLISKSLMVKLSTRMALGQGGYTAVSLRL